MLIANAIFAYLYVIDKNSSQCRFLFSAAGAEVMDESGEVDILEVQRSFLVCHFLLPFYGGRVGLEREQDFSFHSRRLGGDFIPFATLVVCVCGLTIPWTCLIRCDLRNSSRRIKNYRKSDFPFSFGVTGYTCCLGSMKFDVILLTVGKSTLFSGRLLTTVDMACTSSRQAGLITAIIAHGVLYFSFQQIFDGLLSLCDTRYDFIVCTERNSSKNAAQVINLVFLF